MDPTSRAGRPIPPAADTPFFSGPKPFVIIPPNSSGPLFSWHNHSPAIAECPNGDLLALWYSCVDEAGTELNNLASRLRHGATGWEPASLFWDGADINDRAPKLWWDGDKTLFHFARGQLENIVRASTDNGVTWTKAQAIEPWSEIGNGIIRTREGVIVMTQDTTIASLTVSRDGGRTWPFTPITDRKLAHRNGSPARHAGIHAPIVQLAEGGLMTIGRLNTESEHNGYLAATQTRDGRVQLITSRNHYVFNLAWLKRLPPAP